MQERRCLNKRTGNWAEALIRNAERNGSCVTAAFASKGPGDHTEGKLVNQLALEEGETIAEDYLEGELYAGLNDCRGLLDHLGTKYAFSFPWATSAQGAASTRSLDVYWNQVFGDVKSDAWASARKDFWLS
jgi:hypothetical protein